MILISLLVFVMAAFPITHQWHIKGEYICLEAAKNITYDPFCASNGQTYQNFVTFQCFIRYFDVHGLTVRHGECYDNPEPDHCVLSFVIWRRVCGSDNVTYSSVWELMCEARRQHKSVVMLYEGPCRIKCPMALLYKPVCSSEDIVYPNKKTLECAAVRNPERNISMKKIGLCWNNDLSTNICQPPKNCQNTKQQNLVCANNGVTYFSYNALACLRLYNHDLRILHDGPCQLNDVVISNDENKVCHLADNNAIMMPICGSDNVTYPNPYVLHCAIYRGMISPEVTVEREGGCEDNLLEMSEYEEDPCKDEQNGERSRKPLFCASDGKSYSSAKEYACAVKRNGDWFQYTIIRVGFPCAQSDSPCEKLQVLPEALVADPICGSDGTSYANPLALMCAMMTKPKLTKHHKGPCIAS